LGGTGKSEGFMPASDVWRFIEWVHYLSLCLWIGGIVSVSVIAAPAVHRSMISKPLAGEIVRAMFKRLNQLELLSFFFLIITTFVSARFVENDRGIGMLLLTFLTMGLLTSFYAFYLSARLSAVRESTAGFETLPAQHPSKKKFASLHRLYVRLMSLNLILGMAALYGSAAIFN
jgi:uncharacterized membrane protein